MKKILHIIETIIVLVLFLLLKIIGIDLASSLGAFIARKLGPLQKSHRYAEVNMRHVFPNWSDEQINKNLDRMWDNIGRVFFEMPHIYSMSNAEFKKRVETVITDKSMKVSDLNNGYICISGHFGNWEVSGKAMVVHKIKGASIYRPMNNKMLNYIILKMRGSEVMYIPKGIMGMRQVIRAIHQKRLTCFISDQKIREGIEVDFFDKKSFTTNAPMKLAMNYNLPIVFVHTVRTNGANFRCVISTPIYPREFGDVKKDPKGTELALVNNMNQQFETWVKDEPSQWFWVHRRWEKSFYK